MKQTLLCFCHGFYCLRARERKEKSKVEGKEEREREAEREKEKGGRKVEREETRKGGRKNLPWCSSLQKLRSLCSACSGCSAFRDSGSAWSTLKMETRWRINSRKNNWGDELFRKFTYRLMQGLIQPWLLTGGATIIHNPPATEAVVAAWKISSDFFGSQKVSVHQKTLHGNFSHIKKSGLK